VQQELTAPGVLERFLPVEGANTLRKCFAGLWGLEKDDAEVETHTHIARSHKEALTHPHLNAHTHARALMLSPHCSDTCTHAVTPPFQTRALMLSPHCSDTCTHAVTPLFRHVQSSRMPSPIPTGTC
jgi:hypothetical protein